jgi:lysophospholipase L1-like esterase
MENEEKSMKPGAQRKLSLIALAMAVVISVTSLITIIATEFISYSIYQRYPLFYNQPDFIEVKHSLYSIFDPNLGYSFDPSFQPSESEIKAFRFPEPSLIAKKILPGFITFEFMPESNPTMIVILGGSSVDSNLFHGNWPYYLHRRLSEQKIPHIIHNGAVSGYSTNQELIKLIRDVSNLEKVDVVISYGGVNDVLENSDVLPNHPAIHPYQKYLFDRLAGDVSFYRDERYLPNTFYAMKRLLLALKGNSSKINLGVPTNLYVENFVRNVKFMARISEVNGAKFFYFLQALSVGDNQIEWLLPLENKESDKVRSNFYEFLTESEKKMNGEMFFVSLKDHFQDDQKLFYDTYHLNPLGSEAIAKRIYQEISDVFINRQ